MKSESQSKLPHIFSAVCGILGAVIFLVMNPHYLKHSRDSAEIVGSLLPVGGVAFACAMVGFFLGIIVVACMKKRK